MSADLLALLARATLALSATIVVILMLRKPLRAAFGAQTAYAFWLLAPAALIASLLPARVVVANTPEALATEMSRAATPHVFVLGSPETNQVLAALPQIDVLPTLAALWLIGALVSVTILLRSQQRFLAHVGAKLIGGATVLASGGDLGPAVVGVVRPRIVLPADFNTRYSAAERELVLAHEHAHIRAGDVQVNALAAFVQCLNWFNPLVYIARGALRIDQELACDARVMARHASAKRIYAEAMLKTQLAARAVPLGCHWPAVGVGPLKQRIAMLARPAPGPQRRAAGAMLCAFTALSAGLVAWVAQPPRTAYAIEARSSVITRALGAELVQAIRSGHLDEARELIAAGADVNRIVDGDGTPLIEAARIGDVALTQALIDAGADVTLAALGDGNPLIVASARGNVELIALLVRQGAEVNAIVRGDETPLINAARAGRLEAARYLIAHAADVNLAVDAPTTHGMERRSPLSMAQRGRHADMVRLLESHGARP